LTSGTSHKNYNSDVSLYGTPSSRPVLPAYLPVINLFMA